MANAHHPSENVKELNKMLNIKSKISWY